MKDAPEDTIGTKLCSDSVNSTRRPECLAELDGRNTVDFVREAHTYMSRMGYTLKTLCWIPHALTCGLKHVCLTMYLQLRPKLHAPWHDNWRHLATGDGRWFYSEYARGRLLTARDENMPEAENKTTAPRKSMLTVAWNPHGFHVVAMLPPRASFNAS
jgi:hypothetical protein